MRQKCRSTLFVRNVLCSGDEHDACHVASAVAIARFYRVAVRKIVVWLRQRVIRKCVHMGNAEARETAETLALEIKELTVAFAGLEQGFGPWRRIQNCVRQIGPDLERGL